MIQRSCNYFLHFIRAQLSTLVYASVVAIFVCLLPIYMFCFVYLQFLFPVYFVFVFG